MEPPRIVLAIETSQREGSVALRDGSGVVRVEPLRSTSRHEDDLMPAIDRIVRGSGMAAADLEAVAVSIGPGGFTGLRIAIATAKMLAETLGVKIAAVPSALVAAAGTAAITPAALVVLASKGERAWCTVVEGCPPRGWKVVGNPGFVTADEANWSGVQTLVCDAFGPAGFREIARARGLPVVEPGFSAEACLELGLAMLERGEAVDALDLLPLYARPPEAVTIRNARQLIEGGGSGSRVESTG